MNIKNGKSHLWHERKGIVPEMGKIGFEMTIFFQEQIMMNEKLFIFLLLFGKIFPQRGQHQ